jgi:gamma-glutamyltranspeptidase
VEIRTGRPVTLAPTGMVTSPRTLAVASCINEAREDLAAQRETAAIFVPDGALPKSGARLCNRDLARTLEALAENGWSSFYAGAVANEMARFAK